MLSQNIHGIAMQVGALLGEQPSRIELLSAGARASVLRCHFDDGRSAIAKSYAVETKEARCERVALTFLDEQASVIAPRVLAHDDTFQLIVMEDLKGELLSCMLERETERRMREPLTKLAHLLGRFHGAQAAQLERLPTSLQETYRYDAERCESLRTALTGLFEHAGVARAPGFEEAWTSTSACLAAPGPLLTLTHGDLAPSNVVFTADGPRLLDFEYAGARSGLYDVMFWEAVVPFPRALAESMTAAYRASFGAHVPAALDDEVFQRQLAMLKTHRLFWWLTFRLKDALRDGSGAWVPGWPLRRAYLFFLWNYLSTVGRLEELEPLFRTGEALYEQLVEQWKESAGHPEGFLKRAQAGP